MLSLRNIPFEYLALCKPAFLMINLLAANPWQELAEKYGKTPAQLVLRWGLQRNTVVIPKTSKVERLQENLELFDFDISDEDMEEIKAIDKNQRSNQPAKFWGIDVYS